MERYRGTIGRDWRESTPWWGEPKRAPEGAPNVLLVLLDDVGFAQFGCYGSDIATPTFDRLAAGGLRFTRFHTTALCSPTRACVLTGRNHHSVGMGRITQLAMGYPGYTAEIPKSCGFVSETLVREGWATYALGKWHLTPETETGAGSPRVRWPLGKGFERFRGFFTGETHQFSPELAQDNAIIDPPGSYETGYHLTADMADHAIRWIGDLRASAPDRPFFTYFAPGACHSPHQVHEEWIEPYRGRFDGGWDAWREATIERQQASGIVPPGTELSERPDWVPAWDSLPPEERRLYARFMECYAGFLTHTDAQVGRVVAFLEEIGELDNTIIVLASDNGASAEGGAVGSLNELRGWNGPPNSLEDNLAAFDELGGPRHNNNYPWGWTFAGNTPFRRWKREVHQGGLADPLIVHWPAGIRDAGGVRHQFVHAIDIVPTVLELLGVDSPAEVDGVSQRPIEGTSFAYLLDDPDAPERHTTQYFEMLGSRAIYHRGWKAVAWKPLGRMYGDLDPNAPFEDDRWELYHLDTDPSECHDLAEEQPEKLREMIERWWVEAGRYQVLPLDNRAAAVKAHPRPQVYRPRRRFVFHPGGARVPEPVAVKVVNRSHTVTADVEIPDSGAEGVLCAIGSVLGGWTLFVQGGRLRYVHNLSGAERHRVDATEPVPTGAHTLAFSFTKTGEHQGIGRLHMDGRIVGEADIPRFTPVAFAAGLHCGRDPMAPVADDYRAPFAFTGVLRRVVVEVDGEGEVDPHAAAGLALGTQ